MTGQCLLVIDAGTTSTRAMLFTPEGRLVDTESRAIDQKYPSPGRVEQDAPQIWARTLACVRAVLDRADGPDAAAAIGITNQRETVVAWDRRTGAPITNAIVWQDRRTAAQCDALKQAGHETEVQRRTGLLLDPYFSATKMRWIVDHVPAARDIGRHLAFGTVESWLLWNLTGGSHLSDASNASRTMLTGLTGHGWDEGLADLFGVPLCALPEIVDTHGAITETTPDLLGASIAITGLAGDQQAATIGQCCLSPGQTKATYGTGAFVLTNMGTRPPVSAHRLLGTVLWQAGGERHFALEGSVFVAGSAMQWLRDRLGIIASAADSEAMARSVPDNGGVTFVPALSGLGAPHWLAQATGSISGLTLGSTAAHIVRAALEAMACQTRDLATAFAADGAAWDVLRIDGGMSANDWMAQDLADILDLPVERPAEVETTALGAAMLAAVGAGLYPDLASAGVMRPETTLFTPAMAPDVRASRIAQWDRAVSTIRQTLLRGAQ